MDRNGTTLGCSQPCEKNPGCKRCRWLAKYYARQKWINAYAKSVGVEQAVFQYRHPAEQARYDQVGPCPDCPVGKICDMPCPEYLKWWDKKMAAVRQQLQAKEG